MEDERHFFGASYGGVKFTVTKTTTVYGRRQIVHEYWNRDIPFVEDLGRKARSYTISGFITHSDTEHYFNIRDRLTKNVETEAQQLLEHPYLGSIFLRCSSVTMSESFDKRGRAAFTMTLIELGSGFTTVLIPDRLALASIEKVEEAAALALAEAVGKKAVGKFKSAIAAIRAGASAVQGAIGKLQAGVQAIKDAKNSVTGALRAFNASIALAAYTMQSLANTANDIRRFPSQFAAEVKENIKQVKESGADAVSSVALLLEGFSADEVTPDTSTVSRTDDARETLAITTMFNANFITMAYAFALDVTFPSQEAAESTRDELVSATDQLIATVSTELASPLTADGEQATNRPVFIGEFYAALQELRASILSTIPSQVDEPLLENETVKEYECGLVTCYRTTSSVDTYDDMVARNNLSNPSVMHPEQKVIVKNAS